MGREIRRVPVDYQHPIIWRESTVPFDGTYMRPARRWTHTFVPMHDESLSQAQTRWDREREEWLDSGEANRKYTQEYLDEIVERHTQDAARYSDYSIRQNKEYEEYVKQHLGELIYRGGYEEYAGKRPGTPDPEASYEPAYQPEGWPPEEERGYQVFETVSEGTPLTPVFATVEELIDWLSTKGTAYDPPMTREAAQRFVGWGSVPSGISDGTGFYSPMEIAERGNL